MVKTKTDKQPEKQKMNLNLKKMNNDSKEISFIIFILRVYIKSIISEHFLFF